LRGVFFASPKDRRSRDGYNQEVGDPAENKVPVLLWPFYAIWRFVTFVLAVVGRLLCAVLGIGLMIAGVAVSLSVIGAPLGIPLAALGFLLLVRALF